MLLVLMFIFPNAVYITLQAVINTELSPYGYSSADSSTIGICFILSGVASSIFMARQLDKYHCYITLIRINLIGGFICVTAMFFTIPTGNVPLLALNYSAMGFFLIPTLPVGVAYAAELTYPISEVFSSGLLLVCAELFGFFMSIVCSLAITHMGPTYCLSIFAFSFFAASFCSLFSK